MLERVGVQQGPDLNVDCRSAPWSHQEEESLVGGRAETKARGNEGESGPPTLFFGQLRKNRIESLVRGVETRVNMYVSGFSEDDVAFVVPRDGKTREFAGAEGLDVLMELRGVVAVVEILEHDLPVPGKTLKDNRVRAPAVCEVVVLQIRVVPL